MEDQIFISYRRQGGEILAMLLHDRLTAAGYRVFLDVESLRSGKFNEALLRVIETCTDVLAVLPPGGLDRCQDENDWVRKELAHALACEKNVIPIMMRGFRFPENLPQDIAQLPNYNGLEANMTLFPAIMEKLQNQFLHSQPAKSALNQRDEKQSGNDREKQETLAKSAESGKEADGPVWDYTNVEKYVSLDEELNARFRELFDKDKDSEIEERAMSPLARMIAQKQKEEKIRRYMELLLESAEDGRPLTQGDSQARGPAAQMVSEPAAQEAQEPATRAAQEPATQKAPEPATQEAQEPATQKAPEPATQKAPEPVTQKAPEPATQEVPEPAAQTAPHTEAPPQPQQEASPHPEQTAPPTLRPADYQPLIDYDSDGRALYVKGFHFSLTDTQEIHTLVYIVRKKYNCEKAIRYYTEETLKYFDEPLENGRISRTFFIDDQEKEGNPLVLLHFNQNQEVAVNMGFISNTTIKVSDSPQFIKLTPRPIESLASQLNPNAVDLEALSPEEQSRLSEGAYMWMAADPEADVILIDPDTLQLVLRQLYYDEAKGEWKARIKVKRNHKYFAFRIHNAQRSNGAASRETPLSPAELGRYYRTGRHGFPKDPVKAAQYLEQAMAEAAEQGQEPKSRGQALYEIARIFLDESPFQDESLGRDYLEQAADAGDEAAQVELALRYAREDTDGTGKTRCRELMDKNAHNPAVRFLRGYSLETGLLEEKDLRLAFEVYYAAARQRYLPAMVRLGCLDTEKEEENLLWTRFRQSAQAGSKEALFCLGLAYRYGQGIGVSLTRARELFEAAAGHGCLAAREELAQMED